jgi:hypothetical protein
MCDSTTDKLVKVNNIWFDKVTEYIFRFLQKYLHVYLGSSQSRWGISSFLFVLATVFGTAALSIYAIYLSEWALAISVNGVRQMIDFINQLQIMFWVCVCLFSILIVAFIWTTIYWLRHQNEVSLEVSLSNIWGLYT